MSLAGEHGVPEGRKLDAAELARLNRWRRWSDGAFLLVILYVVAGIFFVRRSTLSPGQIEAVFLGAVPLIILYAVVRMWAHCPVCGFRIGSQSRTGLPHHCRRCGTTLHPR